jgi:hypothetical protein
VPLDRFFAKLNPVIMALFCLEMACFGIWDSGLPIRYVS